MKRISLRLFLTLLTFLIGVSVTAFWMFLYHPKSDFDSQSVIEHLTIETLTTQLDLPKPDNGEIEVKYAWSLIGVESLDGSFYVTNNTGETVRYSANNFGQNNPFWIKQNGKTQRVNLPYLVGIDAAKVQELKPNESTIFLIPVPQNDKPFEAGFNFLVGNERKEKIIWVKVEKQLKSSGLVCTEEIMKAEGVLSKTCITVMPNPH